MPVVNLGRIGFVNKGAYVGGTTVHKVNDIRKYNNSIYVCIQAHSTEHLPTDVLYWQVWMDTTNYYIRSEVDSLLLTEIGTPIASASTTNVGGVTAGDIIHITGTTTITSLGASITGTVRTLVFDAALTLTHNATSLILPGSANMLTVAGSSTEFICENGSLGYWRCTNVTHHAISMAELSYISTLTSDAQTQLDTKATLASPTFTGVPAAPTAATTVSTTQLATTAFATPRTATTGAAVLPAGTTAQRPVSPLNGYLRYNSDLLSMEAYVNGVWGSVGGGATGGGTDNVFIENEYVITTNYTIPAGRSAVSVGDSTGSITVNSGVEITFENTSSRWVIL